MAFGSLVPGMAPMPIPQMRQNNSMQQGLQMLQMARQMGGGGAAPTTTTPGDVPTPGQPGQAPQGLLQRLLNPAAPAGAPTDLAAPGMQPNGNASPMLPKLMQAGMLGKMFPQLIGAAPPGGPMAGPMPQVPPNPLGGLY